MKLSGKSKTSLPSPSGEVLTPELDEYLVRRRSAISHAREPMSLGGWKYALFDEAREIAEECSESGWDGYESAPISEESLRRSLILIDALPDFSPLPELVPAPEGEIAFEWNSDNERTLSVTPKTDKVVYAAFLGVNHTKCGKVPFDESWPWHEDILTILSRYFQDDESLLLSA